MSGARTNRPRPRGRDRQKRPSAVSARRVAYDVIAAVRESDAYANLLLPSRIAAAELSAPDAAMTTELCYGTLRMLGYYDRVIALAAARGVDRIDPPILDVLRLGAHQVLGMRVAVHAAVNESVELARQVGSRSATGFANGVLREITRTPAEAWLTRVMDAAGGSDDRLAARYSHPAWVVRAFARALSADGREGDLEALLAADNAAPGVNLVALPGLDAPMPELEPDRYSPVGFRLRGGDPHRIVAASRGRIRVQDEGSQLVALALTRARAVTGGERWLDMCAGPGGKAALLAAEAAAGGADLVANELVPARAELVRSAVDVVSRHRGSADVPVWQRDAREIGAAEPNGFDRILLDAPCTGLGALRRRPEARWRKQPSDLPALTGTQRGLLDSAIAALAPGGILAYVTCSPHPAETRMLLDDVRAAGDVTSLPTASILASVCRDEAPPGVHGDFVQLWPHRHDTDAMFVALLTKRS